MTTVWILIIFVILIMSVPFFMEILPSMLEQRERNKQNKCFHLWRRLDAEYERHGAVYRYRCEKCELQKYLSERQSKLFEDDFMSDWE